MNKKSMCCTATKYIYLYAAIRLLSIFSMEQLGEK